MIHNINTAWSVKQNDIQASRKHTELSLKIRMEGTTYPVSPVTGVVTIGLAVEVFHAVPELVSEIWSGFIHFIARQEFSSTYYLGISIEWIR